MDGNCKPTQPDAGMGPSMDAAAGDWRTQLQPEARQRIVNKIMETLKRHLPISVPEGLNELRKIAIRFEEKFYTAATSQSDYLQKFSLKMLSMETKTAELAPINPPMSNPGAVSQYPIDPGSLGVQSQTNNPGQQLNVPNRQSLLFQNLKNNSSAAVPGASSLDPALPSISGLSQPNISSVNQSSNLQNMAGISQSSMNSSMGHGAQPDIYANAQRQMQGRQQQQQHQQMIQQLQQQQSRNPLLYQHQLQQQIVNRKLPHSTLMQQQQQPLLQHNQLQSSQPSLMQMSSGLQSNQSTIQQSQSASMQLAQQPGLQQNQMNQIQQSVPSLLQQNPQGVSRQQAQTLHQQTTSLQQQVLPISQQTNLSQQPQMTGQQGNIPNMLQNQLLGQQNSIADIQQQQRLLLQQNSLLSMQQQQHMMNQQTLALQQQQQQLLQQLLQSGSQSNMSGLQQQQQLLGPLAGISNLPPHQRAMLMQKNAALQQQSQQSSLTMLQAHGQPSQHQSSQQQLMSQFQSQPAQLQQQLFMQQSNTLQREMQQRIQGSGPLLQTQNATDQKPFIEAQRGLPEVSSSTSMDSTAQTGQAGVMDWQEECYQKLKSMKEQYFTELTECHQKISLKLQQPDALMSPGKQPEQHEKLKGFRAMLERMLQLLQISKNNIPVGVKDKLPMYEKQIVNMVVSYRAKKIAPQVQGGQQFQHLNAANAQLIPQQQPSQVSQLQPPDNHANQVQQMNLQASKTSLQQMNLQASQMHSMYPCPLPLHIKISQMHCRLVLIWNQSKEALLIQYSLVQLAPGSKVL